ARFCCHMGAEVNAEEAGDAGEEARVLHSGALGGARRRRRRLLLFRQRMEDEAALFLRAVFRNALRRQELAFGPCADVRLDLMLGGGQRDLANELAQGLTSRHDARDQLLLGPEELVVRGAPGLQRLPGGLLVGLGALVRLLLVILGVLAVLLVEVGDQLGVDDPFLVVEVGLIGPIILVKRALRLQSFDLVLGLLAQQVLQLVALLLGADMDRLVGRLVSRLDRRLAVGEAGLFDLQRGVDLALGHLALLFLRLLGFLKLGLLEVAERLLVGLAPPLGVRDLV